MAEKPAEGAAPEAKPKKPPINLGLILGVINTIAIMGVLGLLVYTKVIYRRAQITEENERIKLEEEQKKAQAAHAAAGLKTMLRLDPITANLKPTPIGVAVPGGPPQQFRPHMLTMTVTLEIDAAEHESQVKDQMPKFLDALLRTLGDMSVDELSTVQGRFILRSRIAGILNRFIQEGMHLPKDASPVVTNVYFLDFTVQ